MTKPGCGFLGTLGAVLLFAISCAGTSGTTASTDRLGNSRGDLGRVAVSDGWLAMGTFFEADLRVAPSDRDRAAYWIQSKRSEIERLERVYSRHDPESEVSALNRKLGAERGSTIAVSPQLAGILAVAQRVWKESGGAFEVTVGPLVDLWVRAVARDAWPSLAALRAARSQVGSEGLRLTESCEVVIDSPGLRLDLDGLSKGAVLDALAEDFRSGFPNAAALLSLGPSSLIAIGDPDGRGWRLAVRSESDERGVLAHVRLVDRALSVSSSLGSVSQLAGKTLSHVIDPRTGMPVAGTVEAIVIADQASMADAWSTALLVLGADARALAQVEGADRDFAREAIVVDAKGRSAKTSGWEALLVEGDER